MRFSVAYAAGSASFWQELESAKDLTVEQAILESRLLSEFPTLDIKKLKTGVFGKACKHHKQCRKETELRFIYPQS